MGNACAPSSGTFYVDNKSDVTLKVNVAQETKKNESGEMSADVKVDPSQMAGALTDGSDDPKDKALGALGAVKGIGGGAKSKFSYFIDYDSFSTVKPKAIGAFNLPSGEDKEFYVTITTVAAGGKNDSAAKTLCKKYSPPPRTYIIIESDLSMTTMKTSNLPRG